MDKSINLIILNFLIVMLLTQVALAVSISPPIITLDFSPNAEYTFVFTIDRAEKIGSYLAGDLAQYATIDDPNQDGGPRLITVHLKLPERIEKPGKHVLLVGAKELPTSPIGGVGGVAAIQAAIEVKVPYPGLYVEMELIAPNVNLGETVNFIVKVNNLGTDNINSARAVIDVYDEYSKIKTINTDEKSIASKTIAELYADMPTNAMKAGSYKAIATLYYDGETKTAEKDFNIGTLYVAINNFTKELEQDKINKFDIDIESRWNNKLGNVYGEVTINGVNVKTPSYELNPWEKKNITTYYDTTGITLGEYDATIILYYEDKTTTEGGKVYVVEEIKKPTSETKAEVEKPFKINIEITPTTLLIAIIVILVVVDILWLVMRKKGKK